jgi:hypothetical protein
MAAIRSPPVVPKPPLCGSLASGPTPAAHLSCGRGQTLCGSRPDHHQSPHVPQSIWASWAAHA